MIIFHVRYWSLNFKVEISKFLFYVGMCVLCVPVSMFVCLCESKHIHMEARG